MNTELTMLAWTVVLGIAQILIGATLSTLQRGVAFNTSPRDTPAPPLTGVAGRIDRALHNLLETFPLFAAAVLAVVVAHRTNAGTALGAQIFLGARVVYVAVYAAGIPYLRTLVWSAAMFGLVKVVLGLF